MKNSTHFPILYQMGLIVLSRPPTAPGGPLIPTARSARGAACPVRPLRQGQVCRAARLNYNVDSSAMRELSPHEIVFLCPARMGCCVLGLALRLADRDKRRTDGISAGPSFILYPFFYRGLDFAFFFLTSSQTPIKAPDAINSKVIQSPPLLLSPVEGLSL